MQSASQRVGQERVPLSPVPLDARQIPVDGDGAVVANGKEKPGLRGLGGLGARHRVGRTPGLVLQVRTEWRWSSFCRL